MSLNTIVENPMVYYDSKFRISENKHYYNTCLMCQEDIKVGEWYKKLAKCQHSFHSACSGFCREQHVHYAPGGFIFENSEQLSFYEKSSFVRIVDSASFVICVRRRVLLSCNHERCSIQKKS